MCSSDEKQQQQQQQSSEILLNSFIFKKKRCRVLLHDDQITLEQEDKRKEKIQLSVYDIISVYVSKNGKKTPPTPTHSTTMSTFPDLTTTSTSSSSYTFRNPHEFSNLAFQDEEIKNFYSNDSIDQQQQQQQQQIPSTFVATMTDSNNSISKELNSKYLIIHYAKRAKSSRNCNRWYQKTIILNNSDSNIILNWFNTLNNMLYKQNRPKKLLIFINPYGGKKRGSIIYEKFCKPIFQIANIDCSCIISQRANQIRDIIMQQSLDNYDGICCVGGDGTFAEVFNGLIFRTIKDLNMDLLQPEYLPKPKLPIGIIPGGSTDTVVYCLHGTCDPVTATIHIVLGQRRGMDLASVQNANGLIRLYASVLSYGYLGDIALDSEKFRWMGPKRYDYSGVKKFFSNRGYHCEIKFLNPNLMIAQTADDANIDNNCNNDSAVTETQCNILKNDDDEQQCLSTSTVIEKCYVDCTRCSISNLNVSISGNDVLDGNKENNGGNDTNSVSTSVIDESCSKSSTIDATDDSTAVATVAIKTTQDCDIKIQNSKNAKNSNNEMNNIQQDEEDEQNINSKWKNLKGKYFLVCGANISCACARSPNGLSPFSHLGDGYLDIILVRHTTFLNNLRLILAMANKNGNITNLPFVEIYRTKKFLFRAMRTSLEDNLNRTNAGSCQPISGNSTLNGNSTTSQWNCDGEVILDSDVLITSHCQLIDVFMRGPYPNDETPSSKCC